MKSPCEATIIRYTHDIATGEFVNVGVVVLAPAVGYAEAKFLQSWTRVTGMFPDADPVHLRRLASTVERSLEAWTIRKRNELPLEPDPTLGVLIGALVPKDESGLSSSSLISGTTADPTRTLHELFERNVTRFIPPSSEVPTREDKDVWRTFVSEFLDEVVVKKLSAYTVRAPYFEHEFPHAWKNGIWNVAQPLSLDMTDPSRIRDKAANWVGRMHALDARPDDVNVIFLLGLPDANRPQKVRSAASDAAALLREHLPSVAKVVPEAEAEGLRTKMLEDISHGDGEDDRIPAE